MNCQELLKKYSEQWQAATVHPFLNECKLGTIKPKQFNTWLVQDYLFVVEFIMRKYPILPQVFLPDRIGELGIIFAPV